MTDSFYRISAAVAGSREVGGLLEVIEPYLSFSMGQQKEEEPLALDFSLRMLSGAFVSAQWLSGVAISRQNAHVTKDGNDDLCLLVPRGGQTIQMNFPHRRHGYNDVVLRAGERAQLWGNDETYHSWSHVSTNQVICIPRAEVSGSVRNLDHALYRGIPPSAALELLCGYAKTLASDIGSFDNETYGQARKTLADLFIHALGPTRDAVETTRPSAHKAMLARIKADIASNLANPDLSLEWLAGRHGLAPRAIRNLFYATGTNYTDHVLATKLEQAYQLLSNADSLDRNIAEIAYACGFGDLSWFNQAFRRRYKATPSDVRSSGAAEPGI